MSSILHLCEKQGISINDIAVDCIAEIFEKDINNKYRRLDSFFESLVTPVNDIAEKEMFLAWKGLLIKIAESQTARMYAQYDPAGFKIQRNIKETVPATEYFYLYKNVTGTYLIIPENENKDKLPSLQAEDIESEFITIVKDRRNTRELLKVLHDVIVEQKNYRKTIKLVEAVKLFKKVFDYGADSRFDNEEFIDKNIVISLAEELEVDEVCAKVLKSIKEKILLNYFVKGRLTAEQSEALYSTICDLVFDWTKTGGNNNTIYEYYSGNMKIDENEYDAIIKDKIEYLVKLAKKEFSIYLNCRN